jgi:hypothetical protein
VEDAPVLCPACATPWDFKQTPCRVCSKKVDWTNYQQEAHRKSRDLKNMLDRKAKLAKIRKKRKDEEEQRLLDVALKIAQQKADALKWQKERLLRQRQAKKAQRDGVDQKVQIEGKRQENRAKLVPNPRIMAGLFGSVGNQGEKKKKNVLAVFSSGSSSSSNGNVVKSLPSVIGSPEKGQGQGEHTEKMESTEEELVQASRNVYVEAQPAGYAFPLLSVYAERDHAMRLERMKNPNMMSSEENLLRTLDKLTRNEINGRGHRNRKNKTAVRRKKRNKKFEKRLYMYDIDHEKPTPKYPDAVGSGKLFTEMGKEKPPPKNWVSIHGVTKIKDAKKAEHFLEQLHAEQVAETLRSQEIAKVQANGDHRRQLKLYTLMKAAESQDKVIELMDDAGMLSMPQLIAHVKKSVKLDHVISDQMTAQRV